MISHITPPVQLSEIEIWTKSLGFNMSCDHLTGALLRTLAASKPGGNLLEIGTGTGAGAWWLLNGMDEQSQLTSLENDATVLHAAITVLAEDQRLKLQNEDAGSWILQQQPASFDFIFADAWPGKFSHLKETLALLKPGGIYLIDDLLPQPTWPKGNHAENVEILCRTLETHPDLQSVTLGLSTGLMLCTKRS